MRPERCAAVATGCQTKQRRVEQPGRRSGKHGVVGNIGEPRLRRMAVMETTAWSGVASISATYRLITPDSTRRTPRAFKRTLVLVRD